jgi:hypothetical protein
MQADELSFFVPDSNHGGPTGATESRPNEGPRGRTDHSAAIDEESLTYAKAAKLLKVSARTLERWTREGLVPYIRLPQ